MIQIEDILISDDIIEKKFECQLTRCRGSCCWKGDYGAPLEEQEIDAILDILDTIKKYLPYPNRKKIDDHGFYTVYSDYPDGNFTGTLIMEENQACIFMGWNKNGIAQCMIEKAYFDKKTQFRKPISCHLYPVRIRSCKSTGFEAMNYDEWEICSDACQLGEENQIPLYEFVKEAIIRKYGKEFYLKLKAIGEGKEG